MTLETDPPIIDGVLPLNWDSRPHEIKFSLAPLDEFSLPYEKRGFVSRVPRPNEDIEAYADQVAKTVRNTVIFILTGRVPEVDA